MAANTHLPKKKKNPEISQVSKEDKETRSLRLAVKACNKGCRKIKKGTFQREDTERLLNQLDQTQKNNNRNLLGDLDLLNIENLKIWAKIMHKEWWVKIKKLEEAEIKKCIEERHSI